MDPTPDTPQERDDKAQVLEEKREEREVAVALATKADINRLRWEFRILGAVYVIGTLIAQFVN